MNRENLFLIVDMKAKLELVDSAMTTLAEIKARQIELATMIAAFEAQATQPHTFHIPEATLQIAEGEHYAGLITSKDGEAGYHLILMAGEAESVTFEQAIEWAEKSGGALPTRREQALLYANLKEQFKPNWYWSGERHASDSDYAWYQDFEDGNQADHYTNDQLRARAVRRVEV